MVAREGGCMRRLALLLLPLVVAPVVAAPAPFPKTERRRDSDLVRLQGTWEREAVYHRRDGGWHYVRYHILAHALIQGDRVVWSSVIASDREEIIRLPRGMPRGVDFLSDHGNDVKRCLYHLDGDTLT